MALLHDIEVDDYLAESVVLDELALQAEFVRLPADLAYWNHRFARASEAAALAKLDLERTEAVVSLAVRQKLLDDGAKATEGVVDAYVIKNSSVYEAKKKHILAEAERVRIHGVCDAIRTKRDMLISTGAHIRAEMNHDPRMRQDSAEFRANRLGNSRGTEGET